MSKTDISEIEIEKLKDDRDYYKSELKKCRKRCAELETELVSLK